MTDGQQGGRHRNWDPNLTPPDRWPRKAACSGQDPEIFFPDDNGGRVDPNEERALAVCATCELRGTCLGWAMQNRERWGVWGGTTARERNRLFRQEGTARRAG